MIKCVEFYSLFMGSFPDIRTNLGDYADQFVDFLATTLAGLFNFIFLIFYKIINGMEGFLVALPWWVFIIVIFLLGWYFITVLVCVVFSVFIFLIRSFFLWFDMMIMFSIVFTSVIISLLIGIALGVWLVFSKSFSAVMRPILDAMQTMLSFVYLIPAIF